MLFVENIKVFNFEGAMRGLRNPKDSWHLSDSAFDDKKCNWPEVDEYQDCRDCPLFVDFTVFFITFRTKSATCLRLVRVHIITFLEYYKPFLISSA